MIMVILISIFYIAWLIGTILSQPFRGMQKWAQRFDRFRLMPVWTFFAPDPGVSDYNLLSRVRRVDGVITPFEEIRPGNGKKFLRLFFHPERRLQKAFTDFSGALAGYVASDLTDAARDNIRLTVSYISLLHYCSALATDPGTVAVQFMILESYGHLEVQEPQLILNSEFHRL